MVAMQSQVPCPAHKKNACFTQLAYAMCSDQPNSLSLGVSDSLDSWLPLLEQSSHRFQDLVI